MGIQLLNLIDVAISMLFALCLYDRVNVDVVEAKKIFFVDMREVLGYTRTRLRGFGFGTRKLNETHLAPDYGPHFILVDLHHV